MNWWRDDRGETTFGHVIFALVTTIALMLLINVGIMFYTYAEIYFTKNRAERAMSQDGGFTPRVAQLIEDNLSGKLDLSLLRVTATPYPVNRGEDFTLIIEYDYPFVYFGMSGASSVANTLTVPMKSVAVGRSDAVLR